MTDRDLVQLVLRRSRSHKIATGKQHIIVFLGLTAAA